MSESVDPTSEGGEPTPAADVSSAPSSDVEKTAEQPAAAETPPHASAEPEQKKDKKKLFWLGIAAAIVLAVVGYLALFGNEFITSPAPANPIEKGKFIIVPDNLDGGKPNSEKKIGEAVKDDSAPDYSDPTNLSDYRIVQDDNTVLLKSPLDGPCALNALGNVLPPSNYMHSCYYEKNGAVIYTSHAVIGNRTGALENIQYLKIGQTVTLDGVEYKVTKVATYNAKNLPEYLLKKGTVALLTCHIDGSTKSFEDFTKTDVAFLEKK